MKRNFWKYHFPPILWAGVILSVSSIPALRVPSFGIEFEDVLGHFVEYFIFGFLLIRGFQNSSKKHRGMYLTTYTGFFFGLFDEIHQIFIPKRMFEFSDLISDFLGIFFGLIVFKFLENR